MSKFTILFFIIICLSCTAQDSPPCQNIQMNELSGTKWNLLDTGERVHIMEFSDCMVNHLRINDNKRDTTVFYSTYYLSDEIPTVYDDSLVGKETCGCYINVRSIKSRKIHTYRVVSMTDELLTLYLYMDAPDNMYVGGVNHIWKYKRIE